MKKLIIIIALLLIILTACNYNKPEIITHFDTDFSQMYPAPLPGEVIQNGELRSAREHYANKNVEYLIYLDFNKTKGRNLPITEEDKEEEYKRLSSLGYDLYQTKVWEYKGKGERHYYDAVLILLTGDEIDNFKANDDYGYFLSFLHNGDYSPQDFDKCVKLDL